MQGEEAQEKHDKFLMNVVGSTFTTIFFIVGAGVVGSAGHWAAGIASAAGSLSVAYVAKLVVQSRAAGRA